MMTHGPPKGFLDESSHGHLGCKSLLRALRRCKPRMHCFGHIHEGYGAKVVTWNENNNEVEGETVFRKAESKENCYPASTHCPMEFGKETLLVNASIMDGKDRPRNNPWIIDLKFQKGMTGRNGESTTSLPVSSKIQ
jgi:hypothetical protein